MNAEDSTYIAHGAYTALDMFRVMGFIDAFILFGVLEGSEWVQEDFSYTGRWIRWAKSRGE